MNRLDELTVNCEQLIEHKSNVLQDLECAHAPNTSTTSGDVIALEAQQKSLRVLLIELDQFLMNFNNTFEYDLDVWCNRQQPRVTEMGQAFKRLQPTLKSFVEVRKIGVHI